MAARPSKTISDIQVIVDLSGARPAVSVATDLARKLDAHVTGVALSFEPIIPIYSMTTPLPTDIIVAAHDQAVNDAAAAVAAFEKMAAAAGVRFAVKTTATIGNEGTHGLARSLALADLTVISQQNPDQIEPMREAMIETLLFQSGTPTLIVPYAGVTAFKPDYAIIAWDGSATAAHAVREALPLLAHADAVKVVTVGETKTANLAGTELATYLARHGLEVDIKAIANTTGDVGQSILSFAADEGADWLVMGAYGHSRIREFLLGGATRGILSSMTLPVFMAH
jgi:nucleotide-binding universal stress UspA family protein